MNQYREDNVLKVKTLKKSGGIVDYKSDIADYISSNRGKIIIISISFIFMILLSVLAYNFLKKEDPHSISYTCSKLFTVSERALLSDKKISVLSATSMEEGLSPISLMFDTFSSLSRITNLVNESNKLINQVSQLRSDTETSSLTIPKKACYESFSTDDIAWSTIQQPLTNVAVYNWIKTYKDYLDQEYSILNVVLVLDNHAIQIKYDVPSSNFSSFQALISGIKGKVTLYTLNV